MDKLSLDTMGRHLQELRIERGWSLSQLAAAAGIAKSNLSRLEQGNGNPTLNTIWRLATQLKVPFGNLITPIRVPVGEEGVQVQLIDQGKDNPLVDVYWMTCAPHTTREAEAHTTGTKESITVISGQLEAGTNEERKILSAGETHTFAADRPHLYQTGDRWVSLIVTIVYTNGDKSS